MMAEPTKDPSSRILSGVTLVCTVYRERAGISEFLDSIAGMRRQPGEFIILDGGSDDGTVDLIRERFAAWEEGVQCRLIIDRSCTIASTPAPIAKGRNIAIREAKHEIIAITDAGCLVDPDWLQSIVTPLLQDSSVGMVGGWYEPLVRTFFDECQGLASFRPPESVRGETFLPSSRSVAFRRSIWRSVGGYPEIGLAAEDTLLDMRVRAAGFRIVYEPSAIVYWKLRPSVRLFGRLIYRYGVGDGFCRIERWNAVRNAMKLGIGALLLGLGITIHPVFIAAAVAYWWLLPFAYKPREAFRIRRIAHYPVVAFLKIVSDAAYLLGYFVGRNSAEYPRFQRVSGS